MSRPSPQAGLARLLMGVLVALAAAMALPILFGDPLARANDDGGGQPLACISNQSTFFPSGIRWSMAPGSAIPIRMQKDGPSNQNSPINIPASVANAAAFAGFSTWQAAKCSTPVGASPFIAFARGSDYAQRDNGDNPAAGIYNNIVWWVTDANNWGADSTTLAVTTDSYFLDTGFIVNGDIAFNGIDFRWRTTDASNNLYGCNAGNAICFDIATVAIHEVGHFLGFNHVGCTNAVMYPVQTHAQQVVSLSSHEIAGVCALYAPNTAGNGASPLGGLCTTDDACASSLQCLLPQNVVAGSPYGVCSKACSVSTDCPLAYVCQSVGTQGNFCAPGVHLAGVPVQTVAPTGDLCLSCRSGSDCITGVCGTIGGVGICTQTCASPAYACPRGFACTNGATGSNFCWPIRADQCAATYQGQPLNAVCQSLPSSDPKAGIVAPCQAGLTCFGFSSGLGECVEGCSTTDTSQLCRAGLSCCLQVDADGHCVSTSAATSAGGCFQIRHAGDSCVQANQSVCDASTSCLYIEDPTLAKCYRTCPAGSCSDAAESCVVSPSKAQICCDTNRYAAKDFATCVPHAGPCPRGIGVKCSQNSDCESLICLKNGTAAACSVACRGDADCPGAAVDVNGDGLPDGGSSCIAAGAQAMCWPKAGPIDLPACALVGNGNDQAPSGGCAGCRQGKAQPGDWVAFLVLAALSLRLKLGGGPRSAPALGSPPRRAWRRWVASSRRRP